MEDAKEDVAKLPQVAIAVAAMKFTGGTTHELTMQKRLIY